MKFGIVGRFTEGWFLYQGWPTAAKGKNGTIYVAASGNRRDHVCPFGKDLLYVSHDEGETWNCPMIINDTYLDDRDPGLLVWGDSDEHMFLTYFCNDWNTPEKVYSLPNRVERWPNLKEKCSLGMIEKWDTVDRSYIGSFCKVSHDGGKTWSKPSRIPVSAPHGAIRREDGSFFIVGHEFQCGHLDIIPRHSIGCFESHDEGQTWEFLSLLPAPKTHDGKPVTGLCEPHCVDFGNGEILAAVRCLNNDEDDNEVGASYRMTMYTCRSLDGGKTWSEPEFFGRYGAPAHFLRHSSGALVLVCGRRVQPFGQIARVSWDKGHTWSEDIAIGPETNVTDQGYPSSIELDNGDIFTAYYQRVTGDPYCSILYTRWQLPEKK